MNVYSNQLRLPDPTLFSFVQRTKRASWAEAYKGLEIRADLRIHEFVQWYVSQFFRDNFSGNQDRTCTDLAAGSGACVLRLSDSSRENLKFIINDFHTQFKASDSLNVVKKYGLDLNHEHSLDPSSIILAVEVIEHLENPRNLIRTIGNMLDNTNIAIVTTPNTNSLLDRYMFVRYGHEYYFGCRGYSHSGGHMYPQPRWLLEKFFNDEGLKWKHYGLPLWESVGFIAKSKCGIAWLLSAGNHDEGINHSVNIWILTKR